MLPDVAHVTRIMRERGYGRCTVLARRHPPFVVAKYGVTTHKVAWVRVDFLTATRADLVAGFVCGRSTSRPEFSTTAPVDGTGMCTECGYLLVITDPGVREAMATETARWRGLLDRLAEHDA